MSANYPEHEKLESVQPQSQAIGEFLEWLSMGGSNDEKRPVYLAYYPRTAVEGHRAHELDFYPMKTEEALAKFFEIDLVKLEREKRQMLKECRKHNERSRQNSR
jgi:hypothetical protein